MAEPFKQPHLQPETVSLTEKAAVARLAAAAMTLAARAGRRVVIGIAGGPGSGKSTVATALISALNRKVDGSAARLPIEGFLMRHARLEAMGMVDRKGSPESFEAQSFLEFLTKLKGARSTLEAPTYSRRNEDVVANTLRIPASVPILVVEGSYLLLDMPPWDKVKLVLDFSAFLNVPREKVRARLLKRSSEFGYATESRKALLVDAVEMENFDLVAPSAARADLVLNIMSAA